MCTFLKFIALCSLVACSYDLGALQGTGDGGIADGAADTLPLTDMHADVAPVGIQFGTGGIGATSGTGGVPGSGGVVVLSGTGGAPISTGGSPGAGGVTGTGGAPSLGLILLHNSGHDYLFAMNGTADPANNTIGTGYWYSWQMAQDFCRSQGRFDLIAIDTEIENVWLQAQATMAFAAAGLSVAPVWLGYTNQANIANWVWSSGSTSMYTRWTPGQPDNFHGDDERCASFNPATSEWNDRKCVKVSAFVCESL